MLHREKVYFGERCCDNEPGECGTKAVNEALEEARKQYEQTLESSTEASSDEPV